jgi:hypothetical protein
MFLVNLTWTGMVAAQTVTLLGTAAIFLILCGVKRGVRTPAMMIFEIIFSKVMEVLRIVGLV